MTLITIVSWSTGIAKGAGTGKKKGDGIGIAKGAARANLGFS